MYGFNLRIVVILQGQRMFNKFLRDNGLSSTYDHYEGWMCYFEWEGNEL